MSDILDRFSAISSRMNAESTFDRLKEDGATNLEILMHLEAELATLERYVERIRHQIALTKRNIATDERCAKEAV